MVPGSRGCGSTVLATTATLAPSCAARKAIARPIPRLAPVIKRVLPLSVDMRGTFRKWLRSERGTEHTGGGGLSASNPRRAIMTKECPNDLSPKFLIGTLGLRASFVIRASCLSAIARSVCRALDDFEAVPKGVAKLETLAARDRHAGFEREAAFG